MPSFSAYSEGSYTDIVNKIKKKYFQKPHKILSLVASNEEFFIKNTSTNHPSFLRILKEFKKTAYFYIQISK